VQLTFVLRLQASAANVERARSLTWAEAMKSGEAPLPQQTDEDASYDSSLSSDSPDVHQLAHDARKKRAEVSAKQRMWNDAVEVSWTKLDCALGCYFCVRCINAYDGWGSAFSACVQRLDERIVRLCSCLDKGAAG
jgi:hypothetical protein